MHPSLIPHTQDIQDEMADLMEQANEVQELMGRSYTLPEDIDENDLEAGRSYGRSTSILVYVVVVVVINSPKHPRRAYLIELEALGDDLDMELEEPTYLDE